MNNCEDQSVTADDDLAIPKSSVHRMLQNRISLITYRLLLVQELGVRDYEAPTFFNTFFVRNMQSGASLLKQNTFQMNASFMWNENRKIILLEFGSQESLIRLDKYEEKVKSYSLVRQYFQWSHWATLN